MAQKLTILEGGIFEDLVFFLNRSHQQLLQNVIFIFAQSVLCEKKSKVAEPFSGSIALPARPKKLKLVGTYYFDAFYELRKGYLKISTENVSSRKK